MKNCKSFLAVFALLGLGLSAMAQVIVIDSGYCGANGNNLEWKLTSDSVLTIGGSGDMEDFYGLTAPWPATILTVVIGDSVTTIGSCAFAYCSNLNSITIPNSVTNIGNLTFASCRNLTTITIPNSVTSIGEGSFGLCHSLTSITIPNSVTSIGHSAFADCSSLITVTIPNSVTSIRSGAFAYCSGLTSIICNTITPPVLASDVFLKVPKNIPVYIPCESYNSYRNADEWCSFTNFISKDATFTASTLSIEKVNNSFIIIWQGNVTSYKLYRNDELLVTINTGSYVDTNLMDGVTYCYKVKAIEDCESEFSDTVCETFSNDVGIVGANNYLPLRVYPNPVNNQLRIANYGGGEIEIYNVVGQCVGTYGIRPKDNTIDISHLAKGMYYLKIEDKTVKIIKN